jgi:hypothetical protein
MHPEDSGRGKLRDHATDASPGLCRLIPGQAYRPKRGPAREFLTASGSATPVDAALPTGHKIVYSHSS